MNLKFRVYDKVKKEWLLGYELPNLGGFSMVGEMMMMGEWAGVLSEYFPDRIKDLDIMQFTGLYDKNNKEIYDKDILLNHFRNQKLIVLWDTEIIGSKGGGWNYKKLQGDESMTWVVYPENIEIIGNIYENNNK